MLTEKIKLSKYKTFFFDCDGVLLDSNSMKDNAFYQIGSQFSEQIGQQIKSYHQEHGAISRFIKLKYLITDILKIDYDEQLYQKLLNEYNHCTQTESKNIEVTKGAVKLLEKLSGYTKFIVSGAPQVELEEVLPQKKIAHFFTQMCGSPAGKIELTAALIKKYNVDVKTSLFLGDAKKDYQTAMYFGMDFIFISRYTNFYHYRDYFKDRPIYHALDLSEL